ncbi:UNVERIFIED_CONTAM: hypothetical protein GTU68_066766 [Idotea baltica]|nr:hypothetical protein [Idotea baltica]
MKVAVVGATGMVGRVMLQVLEERNFPVTELLPVASERSVGSKVTFKNREHTVVSIQDAIDAECDLAIFSAGGGTSKEWAPKFAEVNTIVVDNSSAWRMDSTKKLIVPEVNANTLTKEDKIIANPNCSTIQMVVALNPLHKQFGIDRLVISTYQSVTGTGKAAVNQLRAERTGTQNEENKVYPYNIDLNCIPHCDVFQENGYTREEMKLARETRKIFGDDSLRITATAVRVPVMGGHSESVNASFKKDFEMNEVNDILKQADGVTLMDNPENEVYPMPYFSEGKDDVFVGRVRKDESADRTMNMWIVSDNLRKGAATNAVQIAEHLIDKGFLQAI